MQKGYGKFIKQHRIKSGFKIQKDLADVTEISAATISRIENGLNKPEVETLKELSRFLTSTTYEELMVACGYSSGEVHLNINEFEKWKPVIEMFEEKGIEPEEILLFKSLMSKLLK